MQVIELKEGVEEDCINLVRDYVKKMAMKITYPYIIGLVV